MSPREQSFPDTTERTRYLNSQTMAAHTRPARVQTKYNPSMENEKRAQSSTPNQETTATGREKWAFFSGQMLGISTAPQVRPHAQANTKHTPCSVFFCFGLFLCFPFFLLREKKDMKLVGEGRGSGEKLRERKEFAQNILHENILKTNLKQFLG